MTTTSRRSPLFTWSSDFVVVSLSLPSLSSLRSTTVIRWSAESATLVFLLVLTTAVRRSAVTAANFVLRRSWSNFSYSPLSMVCHSSIIALFCCLLWKPNTLSGSKGKATCYCKMGREWYSIWGWKKLILIREHTLQHSCSQILLWWWVPRCSTRAQRSCCCWMESWRILGGSTQHLSAGRHRNPCSSWEWARTPHPRYWIAATRTGSRGKGGPFRWRPLGGCIRRWRSCLEPSGKKRLHTKTMVPSPQTPLSIGLGAQMERHSVHLLR